MPARPGRTRRRLRRRRDDPRLRRARPADGAGARALEDADAHRRRRRPRRRRKVALGAIGARPVLRAAHRQPRRDASTCSGCSRRQRGAAAAPCHGCVQPLRLRRRVGIGPTRRRGAPSQEAAVSIGDIKVSHGEVQFSDFYIKPNYSAHLTDVSGSVSALSATQAGKRRGCRPRRKHRAGRDTRDAESVRARALARSHGQGHRHRPAAAHRLFGQVRGIRHHARARCRSRSITRSTTAGSRRPTSSCSTS